ILRRIPWKTEREIEDLQVVDAEVLEAEAFGAADLERGPTADLERCIVAGEYLQFRACDLDVGLAAGLLAEADRSPDFEQAGEADRGVDLELRHARRIADRELTEARDRFGYAIARAIEHEAELRR